MTSQHEMILPFTTQKEILDGENCYINDQTGALRSVGICEKYVHGPKYPFWQEYVNLCRENAKHYEVSMRALDRALWKLRGKIITETPR